MYYTSSILTLVRSFRNIIIARCAAMISRQLMWKFFPFILTRFWSPERLPHSAYDSITKLGGLISLSNSLGGLISTTSVPYWKTVVGDKGPRSLCKDLKNSGAGEIACIVGK